MNLGRRIVYDNQTGKVILDTGEQTDATEERPVWNGITYIDLEYGAYKDEFSRVIKYHVDPTAKTVVFDELQPIPITTEQQIENIAKTLFTFNRAFTNSNKNAELVKAILDAINNLV
ncbi:hypothetical protein [Clostridium kluyveri]|uniref:Uncharacterized protein n=1 Tax=Clostridium kluyveri TaxID=1534 RepID=A0A1L5FBT0_CLOKL|nr:hypothetical protein [Clostridium kluyveri]APM40466.1 hypothetical protein BS101_17885 [Clostridium kluyveri]